MAASSTKRRLAFSFLEDIKSVKSLAIHHGSGKIACASGNDIIFCDLAREKYFKTVYAQIKFEDDVKTLI